MVHSSSGLLEHTERFDERRWETLSRPTDIEVLERTLVHKSVICTIAAPWRYVPLSLCSPVTVSWDLEIAKGIALGAELLGL